MCGNAHLVETSFWTRQGFNCSSECNVCCDLQLHLGFSVSVEMMICFNLLFLEYCTDLLVIKVKELALIQENHVKYFLSLGFWQTGGILCLFAYFSIFLLCFLPCELSLYYGPGTVWWWEKWSLVKKKLFCSRSASINHWKSQESLMQCLNFFPLCSRTLWTEKERVETNM